MCIVSLKKNNSVKLSSLTTTTQVEKLKRGNGKFQREKIYPGVQKKSVPIERNEINTGESMWINKRAQAKKNDNQVSNFCRIATIG